MSALYLPCLGPLWPRLQTYCICHVALCVRHVSAPCLLFARCSLFIRSLSAFVWVYGLWHMVWLWPLSARCPLYVLCAFVCSVSAFVRLSRGLCIGLGPLPAVRLVAFSQQFSRLPQSVTAHLRPVFCFPPFVGVFCVFVT